MKSEGQPIEAIVDSELSVLVFRQGRARLEIHDTGRDGKGIRSYAATLLTPWGILSASGLRAMPDRRSLSDAEGLLGGHVIAPWANDSRQGIAFSLPHGLQYLQTADPSGTQAGLTLYEWVIQRESDD